VLRVLGLSTSWNGPEITRSVKYILLFVRGEIREDRANPLEIILRTFVLRSLRTGNRVQLPGLLERILLVWNSTSALGLLSSPLIIWAVLRFGLASTRNRSDISWSVKWQFLVILWCRGTWVAHPVKVVII
jgi:hypothetical protein